MRTYSPGKSLIAGASLVVLAGVQYELWFGQRPNIDDGDLFYGFPFRHRTVRSGWCLADNSCGADSVSYSLLAINLLLMGVLLTAAAVIGRRFAVSKETRAQYESDESVAQAEGELADSQSRFP